MKDVLFLLASLPFSFAFFYVVGFGAELGTTSAKALVKKNRKNKGE